MKDNKVEWIRRLSKGSHAKQEVLPKTACTENISPEKFPLANCRHHGGEQRRRKLGANRQKRTMGEGETTPDARSLFWHQALALRKR